MGIDIVAALAMFRSQGELFVPEAMRSAARADYIVSGNKRDFPVGSRTA